MTMTTCAAFPTAHAAPEVKAEQDQQMIPIPYNTPDAQANSYYTAYYSRDGGRALMTLNQYGYTAAAERSVQYANRQMMYFLQNGLTIGGVNIPGHYTVVVHEPMLYSTVLVPHAGWATRYTKEKFGDEYQNLGNQETDGHGLMMLANYSTWQNLGSTAAWVEENWSAVKEAPTWILWCFEHPDLSFAKDGLLYAESEAGMMQYTMYCNVPCMLGMYGYAEMAETAGHTAEATWWGACADAMKVAIEKRFLRKRSTTWNSTGFGFFHDPVITMLADVYGYTASSSENLKLSPFPTGRGAGDGGKKYRYAIGEAYKAGVCHLNCNKF